MIHVLGTLDPKRHSQMDVMGIDGITQCIDRMHEGKKIAIPIFGGGIDMQCIGNSHPSGKGMNGQIYYAGEEAPSVTTNKGEGNKIAIPVVNATAKGYDLCRVGVRHGKPNRPREQDEKGESG